MNKLPNATVAPLCIAHRGGPKDQASNENSLVAIQESLALGVDAIEIDIWNIGGVLVAIHDRCLGRLIPGNEIITNLSFKQLQNISHTNNAPLATVQEILIATNNRAILNIEIKGPDCTKPLCQLLKKLAQQNSIDLSQIVISSFDQPQIVSCKKIIPEIKIGVLVYGIPLELAHVAETLSAYFMGVSIDFINHALVQDCHRLGVRAWSYTANNELDYQYLTAMKVDGIFTDHPKKLKSFIKNIS